MGGRRGVGGGRETETGMEEEIGRETEKGVEEGVNKGDEHVYNGMVEVITVEIGNNSSMGEKVVNG